MDTAHFLAALLGWYLVLIMPLWVIRRERLNEVMRSFFDSPALIFFSGSVAIFLGLLLLLFHHQWSLDWKGLITVMGYLSVIKGLIRLYLPEYCRNMAQKLVESGWILSVAIIFWIIGLFFLHAAYYN